MWETGWRRWARLLTTGPPDTHSGRGKITGTTPATLQIHISAVGGDVGATYQHMSQDGVKHGYLLSTLAAFDRESLHD